MWTTFLDWALTLAGTVFMAVIISMAYRTAYTLPVRRRKALRSAAVFLAVCLLLAMSVTFWHGPVHLFSAF